MAITLMHGGAIAGQYQTLAQAVGASRDGDAVLLPAGVYLNEFANVATKITIQGMGGMARLVATRIPDNGRAILRTATDVTLKNLDMSGAADRGGNGTAILHVGGNLTIEDCRIHDNQDGLLAGPDVAALGTITIRQTEFAHNGAGDGYTHNLYVGTNNDASRPNTLLIANSYFHDAAVGHEIKSRADVTIIRDSIIASGANGTDSYAIDLPNGGAVVLTGNFIAKGPNSLNQAVVHFGGEPVPPHPGSTLTLTGNVITSQYPGSAVLVSNAIGPADATITGNQLYALATEAPGNTRLDAPPPVPSTLPWHLADTNAGTIVQATGAFVLGSHVTARAFRQMGAGSELELRQGSTLTLTGVDGPALDIEGAGRMVGATLMASGQMEIGQSDDGALSVLNSSATAPATRLGGGLAGHGTLMLNASDWRDTRAGDDAMVIGDAGAGRLDARFDATLTEAGGVQLGVQPGGAGTAVVAGGAQWIIAGKLSVGLAGAGLVRAEAAGTASLYRGGHIAVDGGIVLGHAGTLAAAHRGTIRAGSVTMEAGAAITVDSDATLDIGAAQAGQTTRPDRPGITVDPGHTLEGAGTVTGALTVDGTIVADRPGTLDVIGPVAGTGVLAARNGAVLRLGGGIPAGIVLRLDDAAIDLAGLPFRGLSPNPIAYDAASGLLTVSAAGIGTVRIEAAAGRSLADFTARQDDTTGTVIAGPRR